MRTELTVFGGSSWHDAHDDEATRVDLLAPRFGSDDEATSCDSPWALEGAPAVVLTAKHPVPRRQPPRALVSLRCELPAAFFGDEAAERRARRAGGGWFGAVIVAAAATFGVAALYRAHVRPAPTPTMTIATPEAAKPAVAEPTALAPQDDPPPLEFAKRHHPKSTSGKPSRSPRRLPLPPAPDSDPT